MKSRNTASLWLVIAILFSFGCSTTTTRQKQTSGHETSTEEWSVLERMLNDRRMWMDHAW